MSEKALRVWMDSDPEPDGVSRVRDAGGDVWIRGLDGGWRMDDYLNSGWGLGFSWRNINNCYGPLREVVS